MKTLTSSHTKIRIQISSTAFTLLLAVFCFFSLTASFLAQEKAARSSDEEGISVPASSVEALPTFSMGLNSQLFPYASGSKSARGAEVADPTAVYANSSVSAFTGYIIFNAGQVNGITRLVADNLGLVGTPPHNIGYIFYVLCNGNPSTVSARPKVRYYLDNSNAPGAFIQGFNFPPASVPTSSCAPFVARLPLSTQFAVTSNAMWAAMSFDNASGATATNEQMNLIAMPFYNPPEAGTSNNNFFLSTGTPGEFTSNNPTGGLQTFVSSGGPNPDPPDNFGWELRRRVKIAPFERVGTATQPPSSTVSWTVTLDTTDPADGTQLTGLSTANFALGATGSATGTITSVIPNGGGNNSWTVSANVGAGEGTLTLNIVTDAGLNTGLGHTLPIAGAPFVIGGGSGGGPGVVISQVYSGGGSGTAGTTYTHDYVELKNISTSPKSLSGLSLYYGSPTGQLASTAGNAFALPSVTLAPGQYYLVQTAGAGAAGSAVPSPDVVTSNLSMGGGSGKVALVAGLPINACGATATPCVLPHFQIVDLIAWGTSNNAESGTAVSNGTTLLTSQGMVRKGSGCVDTNNNNADIDVVTNPVPRNSTSTASACGIITNTRTPMDMDGDGRTDYVVVRDSNGATAGGFVDWYIQTNSIAAMYQITWGIYDETTEDFAAADYDGDGKTDIGVYRRGALSNFHLILSKTNTLWSDQLGLFDDDPVPADYNGDGNADLAVMRNNLNGTSTWFYRPNFFSDFLTVNVPDGGSRVGGDFDGDGRWDPGSFSDAGGGAGRFTIVLSGSGVTTIDFGNATDFVAPGDYDGDGKTDLCTIRKVGGFLQWQFRRSIDGQTVVDTWGLETDLPTPGDYNGDGKFDYAVWREGVQSEFFIMTPVVRQIFTRPWGLTGDYPAATGVGVSNGI